MTQITKNATFTDLLQVGQVLTVTASAGGQALVHITSPSGTFSQSNTTGTLSFGPYNFDQRYAVTCTSGVVDIIETTQDQSQLGGAGATAFANLTDKTSADLPAINTPLAVALATKASSLAPVSLSANTTLTRAAHYNRLVVVDVSGGNVTLTATGTDALLGDFISVDVIGTGSNTCTLAGVTAQTGYTLSGVVGGNIEARCDVAASFIASTRAPSAAGATATLALVNGDFTANNLNLTATHTNRVLDCSAVTIPVTLTIQTDASGGYDTTAAELKVLGSLTAPVAIVEGTGATVVGKVQVIQQGEWGGARRTVANTWALTEQAKNQSSQYAVSMPNYTGLTLVTSMGMQAPNPMDSTLAVTSAAHADGVAEYGVLRRVRYNAAGAGAYRTAGIQHVGAYRVDAKNSSYPVVVRGAIADDIPTAGFVLGLTRSQVLSTVMNAVGYEYSNSDNNDTIALAADTGDTNMQIMHRNGSTNTKATKIDLGSNFPKAKYVGYELTVYKNDTGSAFIAVARNMNTQACVAKVLTTNVPRNGSAYSYTTVLARPNGNNAVLASLDFIGHTIGVAP